MQFWGKPEPAGKQWNTTFFFVEGILLSLKNESIIKVLAMLMGELDFTANFVTNEDSGVVSKTFFVLFLIMMALVFMNLLLGLAVSDIDELERISKVRRAVLEFETISIMEKIIYLLRKIPCFFLIKNPFITTPNIQSYFTIVDLEPNSENK